MRFALLGLLLIALANLSVAQLPQGELRGFNMRVWSVGDGLPDQRIQAFAQTSDGRLWVGTKAGLSSFDGSNFTVYDSASAPALIQRGVNCLLVSKDGSLWIGTEGGGVVRYARHKFESLPTRSGLADQFVRAIHEDRFGTIWVGANEGIFQVDGASLKQVDGRNEVPRIFVRAMTEDPQGNMWVGGTVLLEFKGSRLLRQYALPGGFNLNFVTSLCAARDRTLWIGTLTGLHRLSGSGNLKRLPGIQTEVSLIYETTDGIVWAGTIGEGLFDYRRSELHHVSPTELPSKTIEAAFEDQDNNIWLGTRAGIVRLNKTPVSIVPLPGQADSQFESLYGDPDGSIWVATSANLFSIRNETARPYRLPGLPAVRFRNLMRDRRGDYWIGTDGSGLFHIHGSHARQFRYEQGLSNNFLTAIVEGRDGSIWAGTDGGLNHITAKQTKVFDTANGLTYYRITALLEDKNGDIWVGTSKGLSWISNGRVGQNAATQAMQQEQLWSIYQDALGGLWFGTSSGLYRFKDGKVTHLTTNQGLPSDTIYQILDDARGNLWLSSTNNISRLRSEDFARYSEGTRLKLTLFLSSHDLASASLYGGIQPSGAVAAGGDVWFPSSKGAVHIRVNGIVPKKPIPVAIREIEVEGHLLPADTAVKLMPGSSRFEVSYSALHLGPQESIRYRYRLEGLDQWTTTSEQQTAVFTHLPAGKYVFRVQAFAIDNPDAISEASIPVEQLPHFYATYTFFACCAGALASLFILLHQLRLHQVKLRFQAVSEERARLAREMHDTVIQGCVGVSSLLEAALGVDSSEEPLRMQLLSYASDQVSATIEEARESVWALRNAPKFSTDIASLCRALMHEFELKSSIPIAIGVTGEPFLLGDSATHELMMAVREAVANAVMHSDATRIHLDVAFTNSELKVDVLDNGCGYEPERAKSQKGHFGITGMQERVELIGGKMTITSSAGHGTLVSITTPRKSRVALSREAIHGQHSPDND